MTATSVSRVDVSAWAALILVLLSPCELIAQRPAPELLLPTFEEPLQLNAGRTPIRVVLIAEGLIGPWDFAFLPDGESILVNEMSGTMRLVRDGQVLPKPVWAAPGAPGRDLLHGLMLHPEFETNRLVYMSYLKEAVQGRTLALSRGRLEGDTLVDVEEIFVADAWTPAANATAGRMQFGPDGMLYLTVGDRDNLCCGPVDDNSIRIRSQNLSDHVGTTLRLTDDGGVPPDNPFVGRADAKPEIFTYGNRNGYGLEFHPGTGELWELEIGPNGGDEINILVPGGNYGWPLVSMGRNYSGTYVSDQPWFRPGMINPRIFWAPAISPAAMEFYTGDKFPDWHNSLFVGALSGKEVQRVYFRDPDTAGGREDRQSLLGELGVRFRDIEQGPDGYIYFATEVRYASGNPDGTILRIEPAE
jgi:glucose/arabinose dehydrogenase